MLLNILKGPLTLQLLKIPLRYPCKTEVRHAISNREKRFVVEVLETAINLLPEEASLQRNLF